MWVVLASLMVSDWHCEALRMLSVNCLIGESQWLAFDAFKGSRVRLEACHSIHSFKVYCSRVAESRVEGPRQPESLKFLAFFCPRLADLRSMLTQCQKEYLCVYINVCMQISMRVCIQICMKYVRMNSCHIFFCTLNGWAKEEPDRRRRRCLAALHWQRCVYIFSFMCSP